MLRSMFAGVSGLRSHQTVMDVVGNNIANVNTAGFKASTVTFAESISQVLRGASGTSADRAGINPAQIGLGVKVAQIEGVFTQGASQATGRNTDLATAFTLSNSFGLLPSRVARILFSLFIAIGGLVNAADSMWYSQ